MAEREEVRRCALSLGLTSSASPPPSPSAARSRSCGFQPNAVVTLRNSGDPRAVEILAGQLGDGRPVIRSHAAWTLGKLGGPRSEAHLRGMLAVKGDVGVHEETLRALERCAEGLRVVHP